MCCSTPSYIFFVFNNRHLGEIQKVYRRWEFIMCWPQFVVVYLCAHVQIRRHASHYQIWYAASIWNVDNILWISWFPNQSWIYFGVKNVKFIFKIFLSTPGYRSDKLGKSAHCNAKRVKVNQECKIHYPGGTGSCFMALP